MPGILTFQKWIVRQNLRDNPYTYYVFGDNIARSGFGGQAREMRNEPNAIGVPTKWLPTNDEDAFFREYQWTPKFEFCPRAEIQGEFNKIHTLLFYGRNIVIPTDGLGTGLSKLPEKAPIIHAYITEQIELLKARANSITYA